MLSGKSLRELGIPGLQGLDDVNVVDDRALGPIVVADGAATNGAHVEEEVLGDGSEKAAATELKQRLVKLDVGFRVLVDARLDTPFSPKVENISLKVAISSRLAFSVMSRAAMLSRAAHTVIISSTSLFVLRATNAPFRGMVSTNPSFSNLHSASRTGVRLTPSSSESWRSSRRRCGPFAYTFIEVIAVLSSS